MLHKEQVQMFMKEALREAELAVDNGQVPVGGVFVRKLPETGGFQIVKRAHNQTNKTKNASSHTQMICLKQLQRENHLHDTHNLYLFVTVQPCIMCAKALQIVGIRHVFFGQYNQRFGGCGSVLKLNSYPAEGGYLQHQSNTLLKDFYEKGNQSLPMEKRNKKRQHVQK